MPLPATATSPACQCPLLPVLRLQSCLACTHPGHQSQRLQAPPSSRVPPPGCPSAFFPRLEKSLALEETPATGLGMGSGRKVLWALAVLLLGAGSAQDLWGTSLQKPRADEGLPGGPRQPRADHCPPPPRTLPPGACQATRCQADSECPRHRRCCYNGCAYACLEAVPPPPVLDWLVQPKPRWLGGNGWLLDGPEEMLQEACSTTEDGAEPLLCPSGYECHILSPGDAAQGIPNRGQCVKQHRQADGGFLRHRFYKVYPEGDSKNVAEHGKGQQRHFQ
ncbi:WAP four-disulfide core domain protein 1 isoform X2 [Nannospalax galili]|uniref:WAP four-disulfide core domain protein 1 isoform X2 n=1 Tax=Nannospalax galili TaxID=1026970 RepID=UPI00111BE3BE|nr:WAP four-disulfide core domain protein 1 isoform X2 [Nannospalax galili]